jgi:RNA-directed DNA polymerase
MIERVLNPRNKMQAYYQVLSNKGSAGVDGMGVKELYAHQTKNRAQIESSIRGGKYQPQAILGVELERSVNREHQK